MDRINDGLVIATQEEQRLVRATVRLLPYFALAQHPRFLRLNVPVFSDDERPIGSAALFYSYGEIMALISFDYSTPERLDLELGKSLYAVPVYVVDYGDLSRVDVRGIHLTYHPEMSGASPFPLVWMTYEPEN